MRHALFDVEDDRLNVLHFDVALPVLQVFDDKVHEFMWTVHSMQFVKQAVMPQLIESLGEIDVYHERSGLL